MSDTNAFPYHALESLSRLLLPPTAIPEDTEDLLLVLHRNLHSLPFSALPVISALPKHHPLNLQFNLQVIPSITCYFMTKKHSLRDNKALDLAMLANPELSPLESTGTLQASPANEAALQIWSRNLPSLPWTAQEAANLEKIFSRQKYQLYTGQAANRENLRSKQVRHARILHIASHGYFHSLNPDNIGFALATNNKHGTTPGFITLTELFSYRFHNELVVISGCDTGMGENMDGEGMLGLSRGFLSQGAKHVISTLWPVEDKASAKFMTLFYLRLKETGRVDKALRAAQNDMRELPGFYHPFYWAAYVLNTVSPDQSIALTSP